MGKVKNSISKRIKESIVSVLNKSLMPAEHSYKSIIKAFKGMKKAAPLVYGEIDRLIKSNIIHIDKRGFKKSHLAKLGDAITSNLVKKIPSIHETELRKIVKGRSSQTFIGMLAKGLGSFNEKEYTIFNPA